MKKGKLASLIAILAGVILIMYSCQKELKNQSKETIQIKPYKAKEFPSIKDLKGFSPEALNLHITLYKGYVNKTNELLEKLKTMSREGKTDTPEFSELKRRLGFEFDGMKLHELYFESLGGSGKPNQKSKLYRLIVANFGSFDAWKKDFIATAKTRGSGWVILYYDPATQRLMNVWVNEHHEGHLAGCRIVFPMDLFEHAYMIDFGLNKLAYIEAFLNNLNWQVIEARFEGKPVKEAAVKPVTTGTGKTGTGKEKKEKPKSV